MNQPLSIWKPLKRRFKTLFRHSLETPKDRRNSEVYTKWVDVGFLRHRWTNEGEIAPGVLRSNNPTTARYEDFAKQGYRTVLNLRNDTHLAPVKLSEETCARLGFTYVSFPMAPRRVPTRAELLDLVALLPTLEKPVLIHCKSGADRTGIVAAIWKMTQNQEPLSEARKELSLRYLHRRESETGGLDAVLDLYERAPAGTSFEDWLEHSYDPDEAAALAQANAPVRSGFASFRAIMSDLYKYAQYREARWHRSFEKPIETDEDRRRANFFMKWVDHGVLRGFWTNRVEIAPGVIRSNHPTVRRFKREAANGLSTVLNLRGASQQPQYLLETDLCTELGLGLIDVPMNASQTPSRATLEQLFQAFDTAPRPFLMHCKSGADRTGLAAALYLLDQGRPIADARKQLSAKYLHFSWGKKGVLDDFITAYEDASRQTAISLRDWVATLD